MTIQDGYGVVICTCPNDEYAEKLACSLIEHKLAACVQITPIKSFYEWKGEICRDEERLLLIKTKAALYNNLEDYITKGHPYEVPEIVMVPIARGFEKYLTWIDSSCSINIEQERS